MRDAHEACQKNCNSERWFHSVNENAGTQTTYSSLVTNHESQ